MMSATEPEILEREVAPTLPAAAGATVDVQVATARRFPRSVTTFVQSATEMATLTPEIAASCVYAVPRDGKTIEGPSARLAEIVASAWGNLRIQAGATNDDGRFVTARGEAWDVQTNVAVGFEVKRRITTRKGDTFSDDMVVVTGNAAASIALRNAVFKAVPSPFWRPIYLKCRQVIAGDARTFSSRRDEMLKAFAVIGVTEQRLCAAIGLKGKADVTLEHMATLVGILNALKEGETSVEEAFPEGGGVHGPQPAPRKSQQSAPATTAQANGAAAGSPQQPTSAPADEASSRETPSAATPAHQVEQASGGPGKVGAVTAVDVRPSGAALITLSTGFVCGTSDAELIKWAQGYRESGVLVELVAASPRTPAHAAKLEEIRETGSPDREPGEEG